MAGIRGPRFLRTVTGLLLSAFSAAAISAGDRLLDAARSDDAASVVRLIREGADVNAREPDGATALSWAAVRSNARIAELLLQAGANPNLTNDVGISPLSLAITNGSVALVVVLLKKG